MDKLEQIKYFLEDNKNIIICSVNDIDRRNDPHLLIHTDLAHVVNFNVAPKRSFEIDIFLSQKMQSLMWESVPELYGLKPNYGDNFEQEIITYAENGEEKQALILKMGYLDFYENFEGGLIKTTLNVDNKQYEMSKKVNYIRKITITPFPSKEIADDYKYTTYFGYIKLDLKN